eukprot:3940446-Rhodomonas_salina.1
MCMRLRVPWYCLTGIMLHAADLARTDWLARTHREIKDKKPPVQYKLYQECGFLYLISRCTDFGATRRSPRPPPPSSLTGASCSTSCDPSSWHCLRSWGSRAGTVTPQFNTPPLS